MFERIVHSDWSKHPGGRWCATARRTASGWRAAGPWPVGDVAAFVDRLVGFGARGPTLAAFDFPIGLPETYAHRTGFADFRSVLTAVGGSGWEDWFEPAAVPAEIGPRRPFYPAKPGAAKHKHLLDGLEAGSLADLLRRCERIPPAAGCMFWLVGARTVGKAAIHGWQEAIRPALAHGATLWPFDGPLGDLAAGGGLVLVESYPGDAAKQIGLTVRKKTDPAVLAALAPQILIWTEEHRIALSADLRADILAGFKRYRKTAGDAFDAVVGLLAAIAVADARHPDGAPDTPAVWTWEGWILGRREPSGIPSAPDALGAGGET